MDIFITIVLTMIITYEITILYINKKQNILKKNGEYCLTFYGDKQWYKNGVLHRIDGPAIEDANGSKSWWVNGKLHRLDGPAMELKSGNKLWYKNDELHRIDGPAIEYINGCNEWWIEGKEYSQEEFNKKIEESKYEVNKLEDCIEYSYNDELHKLNGQAVEYANGDKVWYRNGLKHRLDGPAIEYADGSKIWYQNGKQHRLDGPACDLVNGVKYWYIEGQRYFHEKEFNKKIEELKR